MRAIPSNFLLDLVEQLLRPGSIAHSAPLRVCHGKYLKLGGLDLGLWTLDYGLQSEKKVAKHRSISNILPRKEIKAAPLGSDERKHSLV
jgi:hypothetical protein